MFGFREFSLNTLCFDIRVDVAGSSSERKESESQSARNAPWYRPLPTSDVDPSKPLRKFASPSQYVLDIVSAYQSVYPSIGLMILEVVAAEDAIHIYGVTASAVTVLGTCIPYFWSAVPPIKENVLRSQTLSTDHVCSSLMYMTFIFVSVVEVRGFPHYLYVLAPKHHTGNSGSRVSHGAQCGCNDLHPRLEAALATHLHSKSRSKRNSDGKLACLCCLVSPIVVADGFSIMRCMASRRQFDGVFEGFVGLIWCLHVVPVRSD